LPLRFFAFGCLLNCCCWIVVTGFLLRIIVVAAEDRNEGGAVGSGFGEREAALKYQIISNDNSLKLPILFFQTFSKNNKQLKFKLLTIFFIKMVKKLKYLMIIIFN
jgi:hypothetical protein